MQRNLLPAVLALAFFPLAGCATYEVPTTVDVPGMPNPEIAMRDSFKEVDAEMAELGRMRVNPALRAAPRIVPGELDKVVAFEWDGPLDGAVAKLAQTIGYSVAIDAPPNAPPISVGISAGPLRIYEIFEALGDAAGSQATVQVDPQHHRVEVIHHV